MRFLCYFYIWFLTFGIISKQSLGLASSKHAFLEFLLQYFFLEGFRISNLYGVEETYRSNLGPNFRSFFVIFLEIHYVQVRVFD
jgi:hypothetical protein